MPRACASIAINNWLLTLYLERPLLARTLIQRCQPSVVSRARVACSMRSRWALRRASRSSSVSGLRLKRRAIVGSFRGCGPAPLAGRSRATRTPVRACHHRVASRPASGRLWLGDPVEVLIQLVAGAVVGLGGLALGALLLAGDGLGLVVGRVGALDRLLD